MLFLLTITIVFGFWYGYKFLLRTEYPTLAVASTSMLPTLNVGDLIIVQGTVPNQINSGYITGDIIVFQNPRNPHELIVHRAVQKELRDNSYWFTTHGDNNPTGFDEGPFHEKHVVGTVVGRIPYLGNFALLIHMDENMYLLSVLIIILLIALILYPFGTNKAVKEKQRFFKSFEKHGVNIIYLFIINILLVSFILFNLWGALTFWQQGANPPQFVTVNGMCNDLKYHETFKHNYNNVRGAFLSQVFLNYFIDCIIGDGKSVGFRPGVPTFSFTQFGVILLVVFNVWELTQFIRNHKPNLARSLP